VHKSIQNRVFLERDKKGLPSILVSHRQVIRKRITRIEKNSKDGDNCQRKQKDGEWKEECKENETEMREAIRLSRGGSCFLWTSTERLRAICFDTSSILGTDTRRAAIDRRIDVHTNTSSTIFTQVTIARRFAAVFRAKFEIALRIFALLSCRAILLVTTVDPSSSRDNHAPAIDARLTLKVTITSRFTRCRGTESALSFAVNACLT
jgi:hypothetical protein